MKPAFALSLISSIAAFGAAFFWFLSAASPPRMVAYWGGAPSSDPFYSSLYHSVLMNRYAAICAGISAVALGLSLVLQKARQ
jgi:hypothetical protein